jgi:hypothetical protein
VYAHTWVQASYFCENRGLGLFMEVVAGVTLGAGTLLGNYEGVDNGSLHLTYKEAKRHFRASDYVLADPPHQYVIDGSPQEGTGLICGAARANDNFEVSICHFEFNSVFRRMELITTAPLQEEMYEVLVNYDTPSVPPCYWTDLRRARLTEETRRRCLNHYPVAPPKPSGKMVESSTGPKARSGTQKTSGGSRSVQQFIRQGVQGASSWPWGHPTGTPVAVEQELEPRVGACLEQEETGAGHKAAAPSRPGGPEVKARKGPHKNHPKVKSTLTSGKTRAALKRQGKGADPANSVGKGPNPVPPAGCDEETGSEGEPDDAERDANLRAKWGLLDPPGIKQGTGPVRPPWSPLREGGQALGGRRGGWP